MNKNLQTALFELLDSYQLEDVVFSIFHYANIQANLAKTLGQTEAAAKWKDAAYEIGSIRLWQQSDTPQIHGIKVIESTLN